MAGDERDKCTGDPKEFLSQPVGKRAFIVLAGPLINYVFAFLCFVVVFMVGRVDMKKSMENIPATIAGVVEGGPAANVGLKEGDIVLTIDDEKILHWPGLQEAVMSSTNERLALKIKRDNRIINVSIVPEENETKNFFGRKKLVRFIGVEATQPEGKEHLVIEQYGFFRSFTRAAEELWMITSRTYDMLYKLITGQMSLKESKKNMSGVVGIFFVIKYAVSVGVSFLLYIVGAISASLAIFNLLPIVPLDGGHLFWYFVEKLRGRPLSEKMDGIVMKTGLIFILGLALFIFYIDFDNMGLFDAISNLIPK